MIKINEAQDGPKTIIVLGNARGGTSMVAGVMWQLGIYMGAQAHVTKHEWAFFDDVKSKQELQGKIEFYNSKYSNWGFKKPSFVFDIHSLIHHFRNPHIVIVMRSLYDILKSDYVRNNIPAQMVIDDHVQVMQKISQFASTTILPTVLIGMEDLIQNSQREIKELSEYLQLCNNAADIDDAVKFCSEKEYKPLNGHILNQETINRLKLDEEFEARSIKFDLTSKRINILKSRTLDVMNDIVEAEKVVQHLSNNKNSKEFFEYIQGEINDKVIDEQTKYRLDSINELEEKLAVASNQLERISRKYKDVCTMRSELQKEIDSYD